ncbi:MAG: transposase family protein [Prevotellaceae bacterium]|jgi:hypothetical protein|nr:transposase family protein [Prevotellaceae bacterium]
MKYENWQKSPKRFTAMTGCSVEVFDKLLSYFEYAHNEYLKEYKMNGKRRNGIRSYVMYKNAVLPSIAERLAFILSYLKLNPLQEQHVDTFDIEQKQCHELVHDTVKNAVIISACCTVLFVSQIVAGHIHDKAIADMAYNIPSDFTLYQETGYQGYSPAGVSIMQPYKKPKGVKLTQEEKAWNDECRLRIQYEFNLT